MEEDPSFVSSLFLNTLSASYLNYNAATKENTYGWVVDWDKVFGHDDEDPSNNVYLCTHWFTPNFNTYYSGPSNSNPPNAAWALSNAPGFLTRVINLVTNMNIYSMSSWLAVNYQWAQAGPPNNPNNPYTGSFNSIAAMVAGMNSTSISGVNTTYANYWRYAPPRSFIVKYPRNTSNQLTITSGPQPSNFPANQATNKVGTTADYYTSGVHTFQFRKMSDPFGIKRQLKLESTGLLILDTVLANAYSFDATTGTQTYTFTNIDWSMILGHIPSKAEDNIWQVEHDWDPNYNASQSVATTQPFPAPNQPWYCTFLVACSMRPTNSYCPGFAGGVINTIAFQYSNYALSANFYQFPMVSVCKKSRFIVRNPDSNSSLTIITSPSVGNPTYTQSAGVDVTMVNSNNQDWYTSGVHKFTFTLLSKIT